MSTDWPKLTPLADWADTCATLHMWAQIIGKIRLRCAPWVNHSWGSTLYVTTRGLTTSPVPDGARVFAIDFDFVEPSLVITTGAGAARSFRLEPMSVADFYRRTMEALHELGIHVKIFTRPVEVVEAIPFPDDQQHASYDAEAARCFWKALLQANRVFNEFRSRFIGKASPVHFFWGAFDLAVTRFSGRTAPEHAGGVPNCADWVMKEAYSHELSSAGFWPGMGLGEAAFYAYAYPAPNGFASYPVQPGEACFHQGLGEFILPYDAVRTSGNPDNALMSFLESTYQAAADLASWDRDALERKAPPA